MAKIKEYEAAIEQSKVEQKKVDYEERRKTLQVNYGSFYQILNNVIFAFPVFRTLE